LFTPIAVKTSGVWAKEALKFLQEIGRRIVDVTGEKRSTSYLLQRLSLAVQRGNAASVLRTPPSGKELDEIYLL